MQVEVLGFVNLLCTGVLAGEEFVIRYGVRGPGASLDPQLEIQLRRAMIRRLRVLHLLGHDVAKATVAKNLPKRRKPPSKTWKTFLKNHAGVMASRDFFLVPTATFKLVFGFVILLHERRVVIHHATRSHPTSRWIAQ